MQTQMINLSIPTPLLESLDKQAKKEVKTRSEALRDAIRLYVRQQQQLDEVFGYGKQIGKKSGVKSSQVESIIDDYRHGK